MLKETECLGCLKWNSLGRMFSGLLDQSDTQSMLFFRASTSFSPSATSDWELWSLLLCISISNMTCPSSCGRAVVVRTASWTALSGFMLCIQKNLLHVPAVDGGRGGYVLQPPHSSHCHYHCHCCCSRGAPPRNCWGRQAVAETVHLSHSCCCAGAVAVLLNEVTLSGGWRAAAPKQGPSPVLRQQHNQGVYFFKGRAIMDYKQSNDVIRLLYKEHSSSLHSKTKCRKGELYSGPEQNMKDVPIERQFGAGCLSPSGVQKVPTWRRDSRNTGTYVTNWLHVGYIYN